MNTIITLDIETIPSQREDVREYIAATVTHPGNIKKAETIAAWNENEKPAAVDEAVSKTSLDGAFGQVVCVAIDTRDDGEPALVSGMNEQDLLCDLNFLIKREFDASDNFSTTVVGHNVSSFDLRFLVQRYMVNGIRPHPIIARAAQAKPWESEKVYDTMIQFAGVGNRISLDKLCLALGLPGKGDITGADVWPMVQAGKLAEVAEYCKQDVIKTRAVFRRMTFAK